MGISGSGVPGLQVKGEVKEGGRDLRGGRAHMRDSGSPAGLAPCGDGSAKERGDFGNRFDDYVLGTGFKVHFSLFFLLACHTYIHNFLLLLNLYNKKEAFTGES